MDSVLYECWFAMSLIEQMINIGNEVKRAVRFDSDEKKKKMFLDKAIEYTAKRITSFLVIAVSSSSSRYAASRPFSFSSILPPTKLDNPLYGFFLLLHINILSVFSLNITIMLYPCILVPL